MFFFFELKREQVFLTLEFKERANNGLASVRFKELFRAKSRIFGQNNKQAQYNSRHQ
jgi:hypothetical protein